MKKTTRIFATLLALLLVLFAFASCGKKISNKPADAILDAIENTDKLAQKSELAQKTEDFAKLNAVEYSISLSGILSSILSASTGGMGITLSSDIDLKLNSQIDGTDAFTSLALLLGGSDFVSIDAYVSETDIALGSEALLGDEIYGISLEDLFALLEENLSDSLVDTGMSMEELFGTSLNANANTNEIVEKLPDLIKKYEKVIVEAIFEYADNTREEKSITVNGVTADAIVITAVISEKDFVQATNKIYNTYKNDSDARKTLEDILKLGGLTGEEIADAYTEIEAYLKEEVNEDPDDTISLGFTIAKAKNALIGFSVEADEQTISLTTGLDPEKPDYLALEVANQASIVYRVTENTKSNYLAELSFTSGNASFTIPISYDKTTNAYSLSISAEGAEIAVTGTLKAAKDSFEFTIDRIAVKAQGQSVSIDMGLSMKMYESKDAVPAVPSYTNVGDMNETELMELVGSLSESLNELMMLLPTDIQFLLASIIGG